jgi:outer membrane lipoprotein SlyB
MNYRIKGTAVLVSVSLVVTGCANQAGSGQSSGCSPGKSALLGAFIGALIGGKGNYAQGAAIGAAAGALGCVAFNSYSQRLASAEQVRRDYGREVQQTTVVDYTAEALGSVSKGGDLIVNTKVVVATPYGAPPPTITEQLVIAPPGESKGPSIQKTLAQDGGAFYQTYTAPITRQLPAGVWNYATTIFIDGKPVRARSGTFTVV